MISNNYQKDMVAAFFIMLAPFWGFLHDRNYSILSSESIIITIGFAVLSIIVFYKVDKKKYLQRILSFSIIYFLFIGGTDFVPIAFEILMVLIILWSIRRKMAPIITAIFATATLSGLLLSSLPFFSQAPVKAVEGNADLPNIIHLFIDEFMGTEGLRLLPHGGEKLSNEVKSVYLGNGFKLYGGAHSNFWSTTLSSSSFLNFNTSPDFVSSNLLKGGDGGRLSYELKENNYFQRLKDRGYKFNIYQSAYINYCSGDENLCQYYNANEVDEKTLAGISLLNRIKILSFRFFLQNRFFQDLLVQYVRYADIDHHYIANRGFFYVGAMGAFSQLNVIAEDVKKSRGGNVFFAHLMFMHHPHMWDSSCRLKKPQEWTTITPYNLLEPVKSIEPEIYATLNKNYYDQARCVLKKTNLFFEKLRTNKNFEDSIIVIHSDHGSHLTKVRPVHEEGYPLMDENDIRSSYSALFAIKIPGKEAYYDISNRSLASLLAEFVGSEYKLNNDNDRIVYVKSVRGNKATGEGVVWHRAQMPPPVKE